MFIEPDTITYSFVKQTTTNAVPHVCRTANETSAPRGNASSKTEGRPRTIIKIIVHASGQGHQVPSRVSQAVHTSACYRIIRKPPRHTAWVPPALLQENM